MCLKCCSFLTYQSWHTVMNNWSVIGVGCWGSSCWDFFYRFTSIFLEWICYYLQESYQWFTQFNPRGQNKMNNSVDSTVRHMPSLFQGLLKPSRARNCSGTASSWNLISGWQNIANNEVKSEYLNTSKDSEKSVWAMSAKETGNDCSGSAHFPAKKLLSEVNYSETFSQHCKNKQPMSRWRATWLPGHIQGEL